MYCPICSGKVPWFYIFHPTGHFNHIECGKKIRFGRNWLLEYSALFCSVYAYSQINIAFKSSTLLFLIIFLVFAVPLFVIRVFEKLEMDKTSNWIVKSKVQLFYLSQAILIASIIRDVIWLQFG